MSTEFINDQWRLPNNENKDKQSNYSMDFDATNQSVIVSSNNVFNFGTGDFTLSAWIKVDSFGSSYYPYILDFRSSGTANENAVAIYLDPNGILQVWISNSLKIGSSGTALVANTWYNVILKRESGTLSTHINGGSADQTASYAGDMNTTPPLTIGARAGNTQAINGQIDAVSIFDYALSASQITTLYGSSSTGIGNPMSLSPKPVAYYPLGDQDAFNGANYLVPNSSLKDYVFDFDSDYIEVPNSTDFDFGTGDFTISSWVNTTGTTTQHRTVVSKQNPEISGQWSFQVLTDGRVSFRANSGGINVLSTTTINDGNWHNIVIQRTGNIFNLYIDKVLADQLTASGQNITNTQVLRIGRRYSSYNGYFDGEISNLQIFNTALPATGSNSVETLYNNASPLTSMTGFTSLVSWWKLDASDTYDSSTGNWTIEDHAGSNDGTSSGMTQANLVQSDLSFKTSISPYALEFDGTNDYIQINNGSSLTNGFSELTVSIWANFSGTGEQQIITKDGSSQRSFNLRRLSNGVNFLVSTDGTSNSQTLFYPSSSITTGEWYHFAGIYDGSKLLLYVNGSLIDDSVSLTGNLPNTTSGFYIGSYAFGSGYYFNGSLSNASIWDTALTSSQVSELYNEGVPSNLNNHSAYSNLVSWWQLGSNSSFNTNWTVLDEKGSNNGTSSNMGEDAIVDGVGSYANGLSSGMGGDEVIGDAPYSTANSLSVNMDVEDRVEDTPS